MKRVFISVVIAISAITFSLLSSKYIEIKTDMLEEELYAFCESLEENNNIAAAKKLTDISELWNNSRKIITLFVNNETCDEFHVKLKKLIFSFENNKSYTALTEAEDCISILITIKKNEKPSCNGVL